MGYYTKRIKGPFWERYRKAVIRRDRYRCRRCGIITRNFEIDHIKPLKEGGSHDLWNLQTLCRGCHRRKSIDDLNERKYPVRGRKEWLKYLQRITNARH